MKNRVRAGWVTVFAAFLLLPAPALAQSTEALLDGWHVVRPGETLWDLASRYLGSDEAWPELHALNPEISDPHQISPGQRVRVQVRPRHAADVALIAAISRKVEEQLTPLPWSPSTERNMLNPRDGVRTYRASSSELRFPDGTRLEISEDSLVFLGRGGTVRRQVRRDEIEIVLGQADLSSEADSGVREVVVGGSRMTPSSGEANEARLRRPEDGGAQVMVYEGGTTVESGGARQEVPAGMGTQMAEGEPPSEPEELLPAVELGSPPAGAEWQGPSRGRGFAWSPVPGAARYVLEICRDAECGQLVLRAPNIFEPESGGFSSMLDPGDYFWRVTAVSESGLDGYPSAPRTIRYVEDDDDEAPVIAFSFSGTRLERGGTLYLGADARLEIEVTDEGSGVSRAWAAVDGVEVELAAAESGWAPGAHEVTVFANDYTGNGARKSVSFTYDPLPPAIHWGPESGGLYHAFSGESGSWADRQPDGKGPELAWSTDRRNWRPLERREWSVQRSSAPRIFLRSAGRSGRVYAQPNVWLPVKRRLGFGALARDEHVGTESLDFVVVDDGSGRSPKLVVEAVDHLGNRSSVAWPIRRGGSRRR